MMLKRTLIVSSPLLLAVALTAQADDRYERQGNGAATQSNRISADALFQRLDTNRDGLLSRDEAASDPHISSLYDSLDTNATIEGHQSRTQTGGITRAQFKAGMAARHSGSGTVGPSVSGGEKYLVYPDGSRERIGTDAETR